MPNEDFNIIKPVNGLYSITALKPAGRREERKRRQQFGEQEPAEEQHESAQGLGEEAAGGIADKNRGESPEEGGIDFCA